MILREMHSIFLYFFLPFLFVVLIYFCYASYKAIVLSIDKAQQSKLQKDAFLVKIGETKEELVVRASEGFSNSEINSFLLSQGIDIVSLGQKSSLPVELRMSVESFINKVKNYRHAENVIKLNHVNLVKDIYYIPNEVTAFKNLANYFENILNSDIKKESKPLKNIEELKGVNLFTDNTLLETLSILCIPVYFDQDKVSNWGIIPYGRQEKIGILIHQDSYYYKQWQKARKIVNKANKDQKDIDVATLDSMICQGHENEFPKSYSIEWLLEVIESLPKNNGRVFSYSGYIFQWVLIQFYKENCKIFNNDLMSSEIIRPLLPYSKETIESLGFFSPRNERFYQNDIFVFDPLDQNIYDDLSKVDENKNHFKMIFINHGLNIPVGIGFSLYLLPSLLKNSIWKSIQSDVIRILSKNESEIRKYGILLGSFEKERVTSPHSFNYFM